MIQTQGMRRSESVAGMARDESLAGVDKKRNYSVASLL